ncbi:RNA polymerase sigma factor [Niabella insulamsoli]|uniref:RNA polymerase sigma factor n=1 Tax=Niabella insulamsoli TaxID=3144874 RepID=UPI0031FE0880
MRNTTIDTEAIVLSRVAEGDTAAFASLFRKFQGKIYTLALYLTKSQLIAEEIVQEVFIKVWEHRKELASIDFFNSWLRTVTRNTCYNHLKKTATEKLALSKLSHIEEKTEASPHELVAFKEFESQIEAAIGQLPPQQQKVFRLKKQSGKKINEIADELCISPHTVKEYLKLAQKSMKLSLETQLAILISAILFF